MQLIYTTICFHQILTLTNLTLRNVETVRLRRYFTYTQSINYITSSCEKKMLPCNRIAKQNYRDIVEEKKIAGWCKFIFKVKVNYFKPKSIEEKKKRVYYV